MPLVFLLALLVCCSKAATEEWRKYVPNGWHVISPISDHDLKPRECVWPPPAVRPEWPCIYSNANFLPNWTPDTDFGAGEHEASASSQPNFLYWNPLMLEELGWAGRSEVKSGERLLFRPPAWRKNMTVTNFWKYFDKTHFAYLSIQRRQPTTTLPFRAEAYDAELARLLPAEHSIESFVWLGGTGTTAHLHLDQSANLFSQVHGEKLFLIAPPTSITESVLFPRAHPFQRQSQLNDAWGPYTSHLSDLLRVSLPGFAVFAVHLKPGQTLLLPPNWLHRVTSLSPSVSLNTWFLPPRVQHNGAWNALVIAGSPEQRKFATLKLYIESTGFKDLLAPLLTRYVTWRGECPIADPSIAVLCSPHSGMPLSNFFKSKFKMDYVKELALALASEFPLAAQPTPSARASHAFQVQEYLDLVISTLLEPDETHRFYCCMFHPRYYEPKTEL